MTEADEGTDAEGLKRSAIWLLILLGAGLLVSRLYLALIRPVMMMDESIYLAEALAVFERGVIVPWALNPGVALLNAMLYAPFKDVPLGLDYASRMALVITSTATCAIMALLARQLTGKAIWGVAALAIAMTALPFWNLHLNSSDLYYGLFLLAAMLAMTHAIRRPPTHWSWFVAAVLLAASTSLRNDGTIIFAGATLFYLYHLWRSPIARSWRMAALAAAWLLPVVLIAAAYWGGYVAQGGLYDVFRGEIRPLVTTVSGRTYFAFEQGEGYVRRYDLAAEGKVWWADGLLVARETYGTPDENGWSVFRAIARNPAAWLNRLNGNTRDFFLAWQEAFGLRGLTLFVATLWGWALLWARRPRNAFLFLLAFAPTGAYFVITFWQARYIVTLAPLCVVLAVYAVARLAGAREPGERTAGIVAALLSGLAIVIFYVLGTTTEFALPADTVVWALLLTALFLARFVVWPAADPRLASLSTVAGVLLLGAGTYHSPPDAGRVVVPYHSENRAYIAHGYHSYPRERICVAERDTDATSMSWYARQQPVPLASRMRDEVYNGTLAATLAAHGCGRALITAADWPDILATPPELWSTPPLRILYRSDQGSILLLDAGG